MEEDELIITKTTRKSERIATQDKYIFIGLLTVCLILLFFSVTYAFQVLLVYFNLTVSIGDSELDWIVPWEAPKNDPVSEEEEKKLGWIKSAIKF